MGLQDKSYDDLGIPISTYLILTSIEQKAQTSQTEGDFRRIIMDGLDFECLSRLKKGSVTP